ncbi:14113_t:CDS:2, partial [Dentiscutata erythropus]
MLHFVSKRLLCSFRPRTTRVKWSPALTALLQVHFQSTVAADNNNRTDIDVSPSYPLRDFIRMIDHMLNIEWYKENGWHDPIIKPYDKICLEPSAMVFHYSFECFEGLKAYKDKN